MNYETQVMSEAAVADYEDDATVARRRRRIMIAAGVAVAAVVLAAVMMMGKKADGPNAAAGAVAPVVTVIVPGQSSVQRTVSATGSIAARVEMPVASVGEGGRVLSVLVQPGDWVRAGQPLAVIERSVQAEQVKSLAAEVDVARANAKLAQAQLDRAQALVGRGFISQADIDQRVATRDAEVARVKVAIAQLEQQRAMVGRLDIRAPAAGLVLSRAVEPGQVVGAGTGVLFRMAKGGEMEMLAQVSEADLQALKVGLSATVTPVGSRTGYAAHVWQVSPVVDPQTRQGIARVAIAYNREIRPGGFAAVSVVSGAGNQPLLPESAVQSDDKGSYVYVVDAQNKVVRRNVRIGQVSSAGVAVAEGLTGQEKVVASAGAFLTPGEKVKPEVQKAGG